MRARQDQPDPHLLDLLDPAFMKNYTDFSSLGEMLEASGFTIESEQDFHSLPRAEWHAFIQGRTRFRSWSELQARAAEEWAARQWKL